MLMFLSKCKRVAGISTNVSHLLRNALELMVECFESEKYTWKCSAKNLDRN